MPSVLAVVVCVEGSHGAIDCDHYAVVGECVCDALQLNAHSAKLGRLKLRRLDDADTHRVLEIKLDGVGVGSASGRGALPSGRKTSPRQ